jgi:hypothetical protein
MPTISPDLIELIEVQLKFDESPLDAGEYEF